MLVWPFFDPSPLPVFSPPEQFELHRFVQFGRGHVSSHLPVQNRHHRRVNVLHDEERTLHQTMDLHIRFNPRYVSTV